MPGISSIGRISRLGTSVLKGVRVSLKSSKRASKTGPPKICVDDVFNMGGGSIRREKAPRTPTTSKISEDFKIATDLIMFLYFFFFLTNTIS